MFLYFYRRIDSTVNSLVLTLFSSGRIVGTTSTYILSGSAFEGIEAGRIQKWRIPLAAGKRYDAGWIEWRGRVHRSMVKMLEFTGVYPPFFSVLLSPLRICQSLPTNTPTNVPRESIHSTQTVIRESTNLFAVPGQ